jgi:hypothetical protein
MDDLPQRPCMRASALAGFRHQGLDHNPFGIGQVSFISQPIAARLPPSGWGPHGASKSGFSNPLESALPRPLNQFRSGLSARLWPIFW